MSPPRRHKPGTRARSVVVVATVLALLGASSVADAESPPAPKALSNPWFGGVSFGLNLFSDRGGGAIRAGALGGHAGRQWDRVSLGAETEFNLWASPTLNGGKPEPVAVVNVGLRGALDMHNQIVQTVLSTGTSIVVKEPSVDPRAGAVGIYLHFAPISLRVLKRPRGSLWLRPLSGYLAVPNLNGIPLVEVEFRTSISAEFGR